MEHAEVVSWREVIEKHQAALTEEITVRLDAQLQRAVLHAIERERAYAEESVATARRDTAEITRRAMGESLNQVLRRLRQSAERDEALKVLGEGTAPWSEQSVVLIFEDDRAMFGAARGLSPAEANGSQPGLQSFPIEEAGAIAAVLESKDPVTTLSSEGEISAPLASAFGGDAERKAFLFPVVERGRVVAIVAACGEVVAGPLELLCEAAGMRLDGLAAEATPTVAPLPNPVLVQIGGASGNASAGKASADTGRPRWEDLSLDEQQIHLKAQRMARVRVAEIRLQRSDAFRKGTAARDLYGALSPQIDAARLEFLQTFLSKSPSMVDYLHLEILRSLAHDDDRLLGANYPGPMV